MLKSCPKRLQEMMPKTGRFIAIHMEDDATPGTLGDPSDGMMAKAFTFTEYIWNDGKLYEDVSADEFEKPIWTETTVEEEIDYYVNYTSALLFTPIPSGSEVLEPILTIQEMEEKEEAERICRALKIGHFGVAYGANPNLIVNDGFAEWKPVASGHRTGKSASWTIDAEAA